MSSKFLLSLAIALCLCLAHYVNAARSFEKKIVLVTGGSSGIGYATSLAFARAGAVVTFCARDKHPDWYTGSDAESRINNDPDVLRSGGQAHFVRADVTNATQTRMLVKHIADTYGTLDIAVNNAGIGGYLGSFHTIPDDIPHGEHDAVHNNLYGVFNMMKAELGFWMKQGSAHKSDAVIVNVASLQGMRGCPMCSMYSASKHGIIGLTQSAALEYAKTQPRVRINAIAPGLVNTPLTWNQVKYIYNQEQPWEGPLITEDDPLWKKFKPNAEAELVPGRLAEPEEMANIILFLASDDASYVSGSVYSGDFAQNAQ